MSETYFSVDVETDGPIPGPHSMLSIGAAAFDAQGQLFSTFTRNLHLLPGARAHPDTQKFWDKNKSAFDATRFDLRNPQVAMREFEEWVAKHSLGTKPVFVAYPAGFDFMFVYWYLVAADIKSPFSFSALDLKTYAMAKLGCGYRDSVKSRFPKAWTKDLPPHTYSALDDAVEQGILFFRMRDWHVPEHQRLETHKLNMTDDLTEAELERRRLAYARAHPEKYFNPETGDRDF